MPKKSKHPCGYPGCPQLIDAGQRYWRNTNSLTDRQLQNVVTTASGVGSVNSISASTQCVYAVCSKDDMFLQLWSTTYNRIVATLL